MSDAVQGKGQASASSPALLDFGDALRSASKATTEPSDSRSVRGRKDGTESTKNDAPEWKGMGQGSNQITMSGRQVAGRSALRASTTAADAAAGNTFHNPQASSVIAPPKLPNGRKQQTESRDDRAPKLPEGMLEDTTSRIFATPNEGHRAPSIEVASALERPNGVIAGEQRGDAAGAAAAAGSQASGVLANPASSVPIVSGSGSSSSNLMSVQMPPFGVVNPAANLAGQLSQNASNDLSSQAIGSPSLAPESDGIDPKAGTQISPVNGDAQSTQVENAASSLQALNTGPADDPVTSPEQSETGLSGMRSKRLKSDNESVNQPRVEPRSEIGSDRATPVPLDTLSQASTPEVSSMGPGAQAFVAPLASLETGRTASAGALVTGPAQASRQSHGPSRDQALKTTGDAKPHASDGNLESAGVVANGMPAQGALGGGGRHGGVTNGSKDGDSPDAPQAFAQAALQGAVQSQVGGAAGSKTDGSSPAAHVGVQVNDPSASGASSGAGRVPSSQGVAAPAADMPAASSAQLVQSLHGSEMKVGLNSAEFGKISIQTSVTHQTLSAQISVDHAELGRALAVHVPAMEEKLGNAYGLHTRVEVQDGSKQGYGDSSQQAKEHERREGRGSGLGSALSSSVEVAPAVTSFAAGTGSSSARESGRLDIQV